VSGNFT
jgi:hypothetical protein